MTTPSVPPVWRATQQLEQDLEVLLGGGSCNVLNNTEGVVRPGDTALTPAELTHHPW